MEIADAAPVLTRELAAAVEAAETGPIGLAPGLARLVRFGIVGSFGFVWDTSTVYLTRGLLGVIPASFLAFFVAVTLNWAANRFWTFRRNRHDGSLLRQWGLYVAANALGFVLNRGTVAALVLRFPLCHAQPVIALAAGAFAGLIANFGLSQRYVFRPRRP